MTENIRWIDNLRALATFCVILIHVAGSEIEKFKNVDPIVWWSANIYNGASRFCVPIFFMIIGAIHLNRDHKLSAYLKNRVGRILPPFLFWTSVYAVFNFYVFGNDLFSIKHFFLNVFQGLLSPIEVHLWFVFSVIGILLIVPILRKWIKISTKGEIKYFLGIWVFTLLYKIPFLLEYLPTINLGSFSGYLGLVVLGYYLSKVEIKKVTIPIFLIVFGTCWTIIGTYYLTKGDNAFNHSYYEYLSPNVVIQSIGVFLFFKVIVIRNSLINEIVSFISKHSFGIYLCHIIFLKLLALVGLDVWFTSPPLAILLVTLSCIVMSSLCIYWMKKIPKVGLIIG